MNRMFKHCSITLLLGSMLLFFHQKTVYGQHADSIVEKLVVPYTHFFKQLPPKIVMHFNKSKVMPGETIWYSAFVVQGMSNQVVTDYPQIVVEVFDAKAGLIDRQLVPLFNGMANGNFVVSNTTKSPQLIFRAYLLTDHQTLSLNERKDPTITSIDILTSTTLINKEEAVTQHDYRLSFSTGNTTMIAGCSQEMTVRLQDPVGKPVRAKLHLQDQTRLLQTFETDTVGMAHFNFQPEPLHEYRLMALLLDGSRYSFSLPAIASEGIQLSKAVNVQDSLSFEVLTNAFTQKKIHTKAFYVMVHQLGTVAELHTFSFKNILHVPFRLPTANWQQGIWNITVFDEALKPVTDIPVYIQGKQNSSIQIDAGVHQPDTCTINIHTLNDQGTGIISNLNVLVNTLTTPILANMTPNEWSDPLFIENRYQYDWSTILPTPIGDTIQQYSKKITLFRLSGMIQGYALKKRKKQEHLLVISKENQLFKPIAINEKGYFELDSLLLYNNTTIEVHATNADLRNQLKPKISIALSTPVFDTGRAMIVSYINNRQINKPLFLDRYWDTTGIANVTVYTKIPAKNVFSDNPFVGVMDKVKIVDQVMIDRYRSVIDLLRSEYNIGLYDSANGSVLKIDMRVGPTSFMNPTEPVVMIDGAIASDPSILRSLNVTDIEAIAVNKLGNPLFGTRASGGSIIIKTRTDFNNLTNNKARGTTLLQSLQVAGGYQAPVYLYQLSGEDLAKYPLNEAATLFWQTNTVTNEEGKLQIKFPFVRGSKKLMLFVTGITNRGDFITKQQLIE